MAHKIVWLALALLAASGWLVSCSGTVSGKDYEPQLDAGSDGGDMDDGYNEDGRDGDGDGGVSDGDDITDGTDGEDGGDDDPGPERCPPLSGTPAQQACLEAGWTEFTSGNLLLLDAPSMASAGSDFVVQITPGGLVSQTVVPQSENIAGARDIALDPTSGHLLYSVSDWGSQIFEIRTVDASGTVQETIAMPEGLDGGDIAMAFDAQGTLYVAYSHAIYKRAAGQATLTWWLDLPPDQGLGEIDLDRWGNLYFTDPHVSESVQRISPEGTLCTVAGPEEGLNSPYGLALSPTDEIFVSSIDFENHDCQVFKIEAPGAASLLAQDVASPGGVIRGLDLDSANQLYATVEGSRAALVKINSDGSHEDVAGADEGLSYPARVVSVSTPYPCQ